MAGCLNNGKSCAQLQLALMSTIPMLGDGTMVQAGNLNASTRLRGGWSTPEDMNGATKSLASMLHFST